MRIDRYPPQGRAAVHHHRAPSHRHPHRGHDRVQRLVLADTDEPAQRASAPIREGGLFLRHRAGRTGPPTRRHAARAAFHRAATANSDRANGPYAPPSPRPAGKTKRPLCRGRLHSKDAGQAYSLLARMSRSHWYQPSKPEPSRQETSNTASSLLRRVAKSRARSRSKST